MNKFDKFLKNALNQMFTAVGFSEFDEEFVKQENWFSKKTWTEEQSKEFKKWFVSECRKELKFTKTMAEKEHAWFDLKWGWKTI